MQRATLAPFKDDAAPLKKKVPYHQLRPYKTSELHDMQKSEQNEDLTSLSDNFASSSDSIQSFNGTPPSHTSNNTSPCTDDSPILIHSSPPLTKTVHHNLTAATMGLTVIRLITTRLMTSRLTTITATLLPQLKATARS